MPLIFLSISVVLQALVNILLPLQPDTDVPTSDYAPEVPALTTFATVTVHVPLRPPGDGIISIL